MLKECDIGFAYVLTHTFDLLSKLPELEYSDKQKRAYMAAAFTVAVKNIYYRDHNFKMHQAIAKVFKNNAKGLCLIEREFLAAIKFDITVPRFVTDTKEPELSVKASLVFAGNKLPKTDAFMYCVAHPKME